MEKIDKSLQKAAREYLSNHKGDDIKNGIDLTILDTFTAGAQWKEKEMQSTIELAEDHAYFAGSEAMREKILKEIEEAYKKGGVIEAMKIIRELKGDKQII